MFKRIIILIFGIIIYSNHLFCNDNVLSIQKVIDYTLTHSPIIKKNDYELEKSKTTLKQVEQMKILPHTKFGFRTGIVPSAKGDATYSTTNKYDLTGWGPFFQTDFEIMQPIYTFGRIDNAENAANKLIQIQEYKNFNTNSELTLNALQLYWSIVATSRAVNIATDLKKLYDTLLVKINEEINKEDSELDQSYLFEVKSNEYIISTLYNNALSNMLLAQNSFFELVGLKSDSNTIFIDSLSPIFDSSIISLDKCIDFALNNQTDVKMLKEGIQAIQDNIKYQESNKYPMIYIAGGVQYGYASNRDIQNNPFVYDSFNYLNLGAFIGLNWNINFRQANIEKEKWEAEKNSMNENLSLLQSKIKIDVTKAYLDTRNKFQSMKDIRLSLKSAESWTAMSYDNWSMGIGEPDRLIKAISTYFQLKAKELEQEFEYNVSLSKLAYSIGNINNYLKWIKNGKIEL